MKTETDVRNFHHSVDGLLDGSLSRSRETNGYATIPISPSSFSPPVVNFIEHQVTKMDTLAGVAIKYGVEIADIKRMNGLVSDLEMFAHKSLQIPLPGRHSPSPAMLNGSAQNGLHCREKTPPLRPHYDILHSLHAKPNSRHNISPAMSTLQAFYGLSPPNKRLIFEDQTLSEPALSRHRKSRSLVNVGDVAGTNSEPDRSMRRRQKADPEPSGIFLKEESSGRAGKGLAMRAKAGSRMDGEDFRQKEAAMVVFDSFGDVFVSVRKSSSASNLSESESSSSSIWPTGKWSLKPDAFVRPIFDGLPKPLSARRNKAALD